MLTSVLDGFGKSKHKERAMRLCLTPVAKITSKQVKRNVKAAKKFNKVTWGVFLHPPCAVVGGGPSAKKKLDELRNWDGDIFAINDTAGYLSDVGIPCYMYSIDGSRVPYKSGPLVKGAVFSTRVHINQYKKFKREDIRVFNMAEEDNIDGIEGGPTGICRTPHLFLKMGYAGIDYFGCEGSFYGATHVSGDKELHKDAFDHMLVLRAEGLDYLTNAAFLLQNEFMAKTLTEHSKFLREHSGGLLRAMIKNPDTWSVVAVTDDIKRQHKEQHVEVYTKPYKFENPIWKQ